MSGGARAIVVGGSICGLTAALALRDRGWDVTVLERSRTPLEGRGAGIVVHPATVRYLVEEARIPIETFTIATAVLRYVGGDGAVVFEEELDHRFTSWSALYDQLLACYGEDRYRLGHSVVDVSTGGDGAAVRCEGEPAAMVADLVVGADGIGSTVRSLLLPEVQPRYSGYIGWRGTIAPGELDAATFSELAHAITYCVLPLSQILVYPIPAGPPGRDGDGRVLNWVWYVNAAEGADLERVMTDRFGSVRSLSVPPGAVPADLSDALRQRAQTTLPPALAAMVVATAEPFVQKIVDVEVPRMVMGRVCLAGDAAFTARPHAAAGSAKAASDAWALAESLSECDGSLSCALPRWEERQMALGRSVVERSRRMGERSQISQTWWPEDRTLRFGLLGPGR